MFKLFTRNYLFIFFFISSLFCDPTFVMIDPSGHAKNVGRKLVESYERSISFKMAESLKKKMQDSYGFRCVLSRYPGEEIVKLQNASFANRLGVDFYISLHIYRHEFVKPKIFVYNLVYNPMVDLATRTIDPYQFIPINRAHFFNINQTVFYGRSIKNILTQEHYKKNFDFYGVYGIPVKPLVGIVAPALLIEVGICNEDQWESLIDPLIDGLVFLT